MMEYFEAHHGYAFLQNGSQAFVRTHPRASRLGLEVGPQLRRVTGCGQQERCEDMQVMKSVRSADESLAADFI